MQAKSKKYSFTAAISPTPTPEFGVDFTNIRGLHTNLLAIHQHLEASRPAMLFLTETQIKRPTDLSYLQYPGYRLEELFSPKAGVCLFVRSDVCCLRLRHLEDPSFPVLWVHVKLGVVSRIYVCLYKSHRGDAATTQLFEYLNEATDVAQERFPTAELVFLGDFNAHHEVWLRSSKTDHAGKSAHAFAHSHGLTQLVHQPTRIPDIVGHAPSLLDLLLTSNPTGYKIMVQAPLGSSDHCLVATTVPHTFPVRNKGTKRNVWHYSSADWDGLREYFASVPWKQRCFSEDDPSKCAAAFVGEVGMGMEYYIPYSKITNKDNGHPWFNGECAAAVSAKNAAYRNWTRACAASDPNAGLLKSTYNRASKSCKKVLIKAEAQRVSRIGRDLVSHPTGSRSFWRLAKSVKSNFCRSSLPPLNRPDGSLAHTAKDKADLLANLFAANSRLDDRGAQPPIIAHCGHTMSDVKFRQRDVRAILRSLDVSKSSGPDGIPALVLKKCAAELSPVITHLFRLSYAMGCAPLAWREANVQPVPKKGDQSDPSNYRPIAVTSVLCKVMERILNTQLIRHLEDHHIINDRQYGFRPNRSTGDLLAYVTHLWSEALDKFGESLAVSLDISKAFDRVWHSGLLAKLPSYGLPDRFCKWIASFLHARSIRVLVDGYCSETLEVNAGVPQGSVLSPTLFLLHINDMLSLGNIHCYADDSTVHNRYFCHPTAGHARLARERKTLVDEVDDTLQRISSWGSENLVYFNASKTQACVFSAKKTPFSPLPTLQGTTLEMQNSLSILGLDVRKDLNHRDYIESKAKLAAKKLGVLNKVRRYFTPQQRLLIYKTQIRPCVEYCSHLWEGSAQYILTALDVLQKRAVRIIGDLEVIQYLEPLQLRRDVASLSVFYRLYYGECSEELHELIPPAPFLKRSTRKGMSLHGNTVEEFSTRTVKHKNSFLCRTSKMWNALPRHLFPSSYSPDSFKRGVKKHLSGPA